MDCKGDELLWLFINVLGTHKLQLDASDDGSHAEDEGSEADEDDRRVTQQQQGVDFIS